MITIIETLNSLYLLDDTDKMDPFMMVLCGTVIPDMPHMEILHIDCFKTPEIGASFWAYVFMDETDNSTRFTTSVVKSIIRK